MQQTLLQDRASPMRQNKWKKNIMKYKEGNIITNVNKILLKKINGQIQKSENLIKILKHNRIKF